MKKIHFIIIVVLLFLFYSTSAYGESIGIPNDIAYILVDAKSGQVIADHNADQRLRPASTTKIMTAIIALENGKPDQKMNVSQQAVNDIGRGGSNVGIMAGEEGLTLENMLNVLLIKSANESANIIAENVAPSREQFVAMMNQKAKELGAVNTTFVNPCGKDTAKEDAGHLTTPRDLATIARYAMTLPKFREIVSTEYYKKMPVTNKHDDWGILRNTNQFLWNDNTYPYTLSGTIHKYAVIGGKTGYTAVAGNNLVAVARGEDGMELISVVMHVMQPSRIYGYSKALLRYGFEHYSNQKVANAGQFATDVTVSDAKSGNNSLELITASDFNCALPIDMNGQSIEKKIVFPQAIKAPIRKGAVLGKLEYRMNGVLLGSVDVIASRAVDQAAPGIFGIGGKKSAHKPSAASVIIGLLLVLLGAFVALVTCRYAIKKFKKKKKIAQTYFNSRNYD